MTNPKIGARFVGTFELIGWRDGGVGDKSLIKSDEDALVGDEMVFAVAGPFEPASHRRSTKTGAVAAYLARKHGVDVALVEMSDVEEFLNDLAWLGLTVKMKGEPS